MIKTLCAICRKNTLSKILYKANVSDSQINEKTFSARRMPDRVHSRIVQCKVCGLVRQDPMLDQNKLKVLYEKSEFTYENAVDNLKKSYGHYLRLAGTMVEKKQRVLEIGCGNGFILEEALKLGYKEAGGVEPSSDAIAKARPDIRKRIKQGLFTSKMFPQGYFDVICMFQVFDHILYPKEFLDDCYKALRPGGVILAFNHDISSWSSKILRERCPIIDIEHPYLYDKKTIKNIFENAGFKPLIVKSARNVFSLEYCVYMLPVPKALKKLANSLLESLRINRVNVKIYPGNLVIIARK